MINKARAAFTRACVNHPRKIIAGASTPALGAAAMLIPLDGGVTLGTLALLGGSFAFATETTYGNLKAHKQKARIAHLDEIYVCNRAQQAAYERLENKIRRAQWVFENTLEPKAKKRILKRAQNMAKKQQWIVDGLMTEKEFNRIRNAEHVEFDLKRQKLKKPNVGAN